MRSIPAGGHEPGPGHHYAAPAPRSRGWRPRHPRSCAGSAADPPARDSALDSYRVAASFSPTLYGLGVVDIALITALHGAGLTSRDAVLLCRIITFKIRVTFVWTGYRSLKDRSGRAPSLMAARQRQSISH